LRHERFRAPTVLVFVGTTLVIWLLIGRDESGAARQTLDGLAPTFEAFSTSHLLHVDGVHLSLSVLGVLLAGGLLETRWGTPRFLVFYAVVVASTGAVAVLASRVATDSGFFDGTVRPVSYGASALSLACVTLASARIPRRVYLGALPSNVVFAALIVLGAAGLALLDSLSAQAEGPTRLFLLPQVSGVVVGILWARVDPICARCFADRRARRERRERERLGEIRTRVDTLLEKISIHGYTSLSADEKAFLRHASRHFKRE